jgi:hypothetical protein
MVYFYNQQFMCIGWIMMKCTVITFELEFDPHPFGHTNHSKVCLFQDWNPISIDNCCLSSITNQHLWHSTLISSLGQCVCQNSHNGACYWGMGLNIIYENVFKDKAAKLGILIFIMSSILAPPLHDGQKCLI